MPRAAKKKPKRRARSFQETLAISPLPTRDPSCFGCALEIGDVEKQQAQEDITDIAIHFGITLNSELAAILFTIWSFGWKSGAHVGMQAAVQRGLGVTPVERAHGGH